MSEYTYTTDIALGHFDEEIQASSIAAKVSGMTYAGDRPTGTLTVMTSSALDTAEQTVLDDLVTNHVPGPSIQERVSASRSFARDMIDEYQTLIISEGVVEAGEAYNVSVALKDASVLAGLGNLYALDAELATVLPITTYLEQARIDEIRNRVRTYLSLPLLWDASTSYAVYDIVHHDGTDYQAVDANTGDQPPSANWTAL